jgi:Golgi phosphoprotein 3 (GPP34)
VAVLIEGASDPGGAWLESGPVLIAEDVLLLLTDDTSGRLSTARSGDAAVEVEILLTGANLVELALMRRVDISREVKPIRILGIWWDDRRVDGPIVCDPSPTGDAVLDTALQIINRCQGRAIHGDFTRNGRCRQLTTCRSDLSREAGAGPYS